jgi:hypothetical protein
MSRAQKAPRREGPDAERARGGGKGCAAVSEAYAEQNDRDYKEFAGAVDAGRLRDCSRANSPRSGPRTCQARHDELDRGDRI